MFSKNFRRALVLGGVSAIAISTPAIAATGSAPSNLSYQDFSGSCQLIANITITGTVDDGSGFDRTRMELTNASGQRFDIADSGANVGTTLTRQESIVTSMAASSYPTGTYYIAHYDTDANGVRTGANGGLLGRTQVDLAAMANAGGACATLAQSMGGGANRAPIADAGPDSSALVPNQPFVVDGSSSSDPDGDPLTYSWRQLSGGAIGISGQNTSMLTFTPPSRRLQDTTFTFELTVSDGNGGFDTDLVTLTLTRNVEATPNAGPDQNVQGGATVQLDGSGSTDPEGDALTYIWTQRAGPFVTLTNPNSATPTFIAPPATANLQDIRFGLQVEDALSRRSLAEDTVTIFIAAAANGTPVADAGPDQTVQRGDTVNLTAAGSSDPDGDTLTYSWVQTGGATVSLTGATTATPTFTAPNVDRRGANLTFEVTATDPSGATSTDTVVITIPSNGAPTPDAGPDQLVNEGTTVTLDGTGSTDPEGNPITYSWGQTSGSVVVLNNANSANPTFTAPPSAPGASQTLVFSLVVDDGVPSAPNSVTPIDQVTITIRAGLVLVNFPPQASAGRDQTVATNATVTLDAGGSFDADNDPLTYSWVQTGGPAVTLNNANQQVATFQAGSQPATAYTFELTATDPSGASGTDTVTITTAANATPVAAAGPGQTVDGGDPVTLDGSGSSDPENNPLTYSWVQTSGPSVTLAGANTAMPTFTAPAKTGNSQNMAFELTVSDGTSSSTATVNVTVRANTPPIAATGTTQNVNGGDNVTLDASNSGDPEGDSVTFTFIQTGGPTVTLNGANTATPTFTAPVATAAVQTLTFDLTVSDGIASDTETFTVNVAANGAPTADAGPDLTSRGGQTVNFDFSGSSDPEGDALTYSFVQVSGPPARIDSAVGAGASLTAPDATAADQTLVFELTVSDGISSATDQVTLTVLANLLPIADAGADRTVRGGQQVALDGSASLDPEGDALTYNWVQTGGPSVALNDATLAQPSFTAPTGLAATGSLTFELTVDDGIATATDTVIVEVLPNAAPVADAGGDIGPIDSGLQVTLDASGSSDPDGDALTYSWAQTAGTAVTLSNASGVSPSFTAPLVNGTETFEFEVTVSDGILSSTDTVRVTVQALGTVTIITNVVGDDTTVGFTSNVPGLASSVTTSAGTGTISVQNVTAGNYTLSVNDLRAQGYALTALACNDTDSTVSPGTGTVDLSLSPSENLVCTVTLTDSRSAAEQAIGEFVGGRNALLLANQPDLQRRLDRVKGQQAGGGSAMIGQVPVPGSGNLPASLNVTPQSKSFSTSLNMAQTALGRRDGGGSLDIWFEGTLADVTLGGNTGSFLLGYAGIDYLVQEGLLIGALVQFDRFDNDATLLGAGGAEGDGWMVGPYLTARLAPNFYVDARVAFGGSDNTVSPLGTYVDGFETDRVLASASAIGDIALGGGLTFWPELSLRYIREDIEGYVDSLGVAIPDASIDQGEVAFSPRVDYRSVGSDGWSFAPYAQVEGLLTFGADRFSVVENGLRGRGSLGLDIASPDGFRFGLSGFYDGIGETDFEAAGATVTLSITF